MKLNGVLWRQIMAGVDEGYLGDAAPARWANIGYLQQEPQLTEVLLPARGMPSEPFARDPQM